VVSGKLRIREFEQEGERRFMPEVEASSVGHDLRWGTGTFAKPERGGAAAAVSREMRERLDEETRDWALGAARPGGRAAALQPVPDPLVAAERFATDGPVSESATIRILGADDTDKDGEDAEWPTEERAAA
jgi:single-strand DNA-binding protein